LHKKFLGKFGKIRAKIFRTPKNLPAPTPMIAIDHNVEQIGNVLLKLPKLLKNSENFNMYEKLHENWEELMYEDVFYCFYILMASGKYWKELY